MKTAPEIILIQSFVIFFKSVMLIKFKGYYIARYNAPHIKKVRAIK